MDDHYFKVAFKPVRHKTIKYTTFNTEEEARNFISRVAHDGAIVLTLSQILEHPLSVWKGTPAVAPQTS